MATLDSPACTACAKTADQLPPSRKMLVCAKCQKDAGRQVHYCSRDCQVGDYKTHKATCGLRLRTLPEAIPPVADPSAPFQPPAALLFHLAALTTLPPPALPSAAPPSFLYFPSSPTAAATSSSSSTIATPQPVPISLSPATRNLFNALQLVAFRTGNPLSVNLMFSLLLTEVEALGGAEERLVEQLAEEYRLDGMQQLVDGVERKSLADILKEEDEPRPEDLVEAIGGEQNMGLLLQWQMQVASESQVNEQP
ncbi:hypothetical protein JCM9279_003522 [Rhodotorula babjevae]